MPEVILAVDPGRLKFGYAVMKSDGTVLTKGIAPASQVERVVRTICTEFGMTRGGRGQDGSRESLAAIRKALDGLETVVCPVDEGYLSYEGDNCICGNNGGAGGGWSRWGCRLPEPYDDYVAVVLGERYLQGKRGEDGGRRQDFGKVISVAFGGGRMRALLDIPKV